MKEEKQTLYLELTELLSPLCQKRIDEKVRELSGLRNRLDLSKLTDIAFRRLREVVTCPEHRTRNSQYDSPSLEDELLSEAELIKYHEYGGGNPFAATDFDYYLYEATSKGVELYKILVEKLYKEVFPLKNLPRVEYVYLDRETDRLVEDDNPWD